MVHLFKHQKLAVEKLKTGSILCGGVGSGKSRTALMYFYVKECGGNINDFSNVKDPKDLYIITTANKRDTLDWERESTNFMISTDRTASINNIKLIVDSWNNIKKYIEVKNAFFIFDEQRVIGSGSWVRSFLKIAKQNNWILLSATPGDTWMDYIPIFVANGFYKNRTDFIRNHVVYNSFTKFPKIDHFIEESKLYKLRDKILISMDDERLTIKKDIDVFVEFNKEKYLTLTWKRWNPFTNSPIKDVSELCFTLRKIVNSDESRLKAVFDLLDKHQKIIIFYNFNYELDILRTIKEKNIEVAEYNGHKHERLPNGNKWVYLVQYMSGSEGWNCIETNTVIFYSLNYSYRMMTQAAGRIDRLNTQFKNLYYYYLKSKASIDRAIEKALENKENFNELKWSNEELPF